MEVDEPGAGDVDLGDVRRQVGAEDVDDLLRQLAFDLAPWRYRQQLVDQSPCSRRAGRSSTMLPGAPTPTLSRAERRDASSTSRIIVTRGSLD